MTTALRIGFVSLGQGPRPELSALHDRLFRAAGIEMTPVWAHVFDDLPEAEVAALRTEDSGDSPAIRALHGSPPRPDWFDRDRLAALVPAAIARLEAQGIALTIVCAAEMLPGFRARTRHPVILPAEAMAAQAAMLLRTRPEATIGFLTYGDRQRAQQIAGWQARPEAQAARLVFTGEGNNPQAAIRALAPARPDLTFIWAYGAGTDAGVPESISTALGCPVVSAAAAAVRMAISFLPAGTRP